MHKIKSIFHHHHHHGNVEPEDKKRQSPYPWSLEKNYHISKKVLGRGSFGVVRQCTDKRTGKDYALKIIDKKSIRGKEQMLTTELDVLKKVHHPNVITLHELIDTKKAVYIITDLASGGELFDQLLKKGSYTERDASNLVRQILEGVAYLHDHEIVHRDLKPENLLFSDKSDHPSLMITDFGLSKVLRHHNDILTTACGTPGYVAPEVLRKNGYGRSVDVWSIGVIMYTLLCGYTPFWGEDQGELFESILSGVYYFEEEYWSGISDFAKDLIDKMLAYDAKKRITVHQALQHPWFEMADNIDLLSNVRKNFSARATFRKAINVVQGVNRLKKNSVQLHITKQRNLSTDNPSSANANDADISDLDLDLQLTSMSRKDSETLGPTASSPLPKLEDDVDVIEENWFSNNNVILIR